MSDSITNQEKAEPTVPSQVETKEEYVAKKAYEEVTADLHKNKKAKRDLLAKVNELQARIESEEKAKMEEKQQFEELYKKAELEKQQLIQSIQEKETRLLNERKKAALKQELGNIKEVYLNLVSIDQIEVDENGLVNSESVRAVANTFKQEHPQLIPSQGASNITAAAAPIDSTVSKEKTIDEMSFEEMAAQLQQLKSN